MNSLQKATVVKIVDRYGDKAVSVDDRESVPYVRIETQRTHRSFYLHPEGVHLIMTHAERMRIKNTKSTAVVLRFSDPRFFKKLMAGIHGIERIWDIH